MNFLLCHRIRVLAHKWVMMSAIYIDTTVYCYCWFLLFIVSYFELLDRNVNFLWLWLILLVFYLKWFMVIIMSYIFSRMSVPGYKYALHWSQSQVMSFLICTCVCIWTFFIEIWLTNKGCAWWRQRLCEKNIEII